MFNVFSMSFHLCLGVTAEGFSFVSMGTAKMDFDGGHQAVAVGVVKSAQRGEKDRKRMEFLGWATEFDDV